LSMKTHITEGRDVAEIIKDIENFVEKTVNLSTARKLLLTRSGTLYKNFPSKKVWEWSTKKIEEHFGVKLQGLEDNVLYEAMRYIYNNAIFDMGKKSSIGWIYTTVWGIEGGVQKLLEKLGIKDVPIDVLDKVADNIFEHVRKVAEEFSKQLTGGISLGALEWYTAMGMPDEYRVVEFDEAGNIKVKESIDLRKLKNAIEEG